MPLMTIVPITYNFRGWRGKKDTKNVVAYRGNSRTDASFRKQL